MHEYAIIALGAPVLEDQRRRAVWGTAGSHTVASCCSLVSHVWLSKALFLSLPVLVKLRPVLTVCCSSHAAQAMSLYKRGTSVRLQGMSVRYDCTLRRNA